MARKAKTAPSAQAAYDAAMARHDLLGAFTAYLRLAPDDRSVAASTLGPIVRSSVADAHRKRHWEQLRALAVEVDKAPDLLRAASSPEATARAAWALLWAAGASQRFDVATRTLPLVNAWLDAAHPRLARAVEAWVRSGGAPDASLLPDLAGLEAKLPPKPRPPGKGLRVAVPLPATPAEGKAAVAALYASLGWDAVVDVLGFQWLTDCDAALADALRCEAVRWGLHAALDPSARGDDRLMPLVYAATCAQRAASKSAVRDDVMIMIRLALAARAAGAVGATAVLQRALLAAASDPTLRSLADDLAAGMAPPAEVSAAAVELLHAHWALTRDARLWPVAVRWWQAAQRAARDDDQRLDAPPWLTEWAEEIAGDTAFWRQRAKDSHACEAAVMDLLELATDAAVDRFIERCWDLVDERAKRRVAQQEAELLEGPGFDLDLDADLDHVPLTSLAALLSGYDGLMPPARRARMERLSPRMLPLHELFLLVEVDAAPHAQAAREVIDRFYGGGGTPRVAIEAVARAADDDPGEYTHLIAADLLARFARDVDALAVALATLLTRDVPVALGVRFAKALLQADAAAPGPRSARVAATITNAGLILAQHDKPRAPKRPKAPKTPRAPKAPKAPSAKRAAAEPPRPSEALPPDEPVVQRRPPTPRRRGGT